MTIKQEEDSSSEEIDSETEPEPEPEPDLADLINSNVSRPISLDYNDFSFKEVLGVGSFGTVHQVQHIVTEEEFAFKIINYRSIERFNFWTQCQREIRVQSLLNHEHIVKCAGFFHDDEQLVMVLEFCKNGNLYSFIRKNGILNKFACARYISQIADALMYMHDLDLVHRDLKPENILLDDQLNTKICDFGWVGEKKVHRKLRMMCGTSEYFSPEMIVGDGYDERVDLWSLGALMFEMMVGKSPFRSCSLIEVIDIVQYTAQVQDNIMNLRYEFPSYFDRKGATLVRSLLKRNPRERLPLSRLLKHPFITENNVIFNTVLNGSRPQISDLVLRPTDT